METWGGLSEASLLASWSIFSNIRTYREPLGLRKNPKSEYRNPKQIRITKIQMTETSDNSFREVTFRTFENSKLGTRPQVRLECSQAAGATQQVVHIGRLGLAGSLPVPLSGVPTAKVDMSFLTSPWQSGQFTLVSWCITSLSKVYLQLSQLYSKIGIIILPIC